ncbi:hypothetical protein AALO_G00190580 [Alosa alosa]|uniref:SH3 domain-containing protein n=1 Tax=Alosa alosa TaxID=278164 RepID=A0AAV6G826_9TELE|nr:hypothetical protein AALO_G00190580 [Alosa alosa]
MTKRNIVTGDICPADYDLLRGVSDLDTGNDIMTTGQEGEGGEKWSRRSTVSLAKGERFSPDVVLVFSGKHRSSGESDDELQEALRTRLRVMESSSQDISSLFKDLSARLLSVHAERDCFILTFKTVEEIWKFSTYLSLGYVARCLENFLCDPSFWLDPALLSDVEICVSLQEEHLATLYLGLLLQEGVFFAKAAHAVEAVEGDDERLVCVCDALLLVRDVGQEDLWEATLLSSGDRGLVPSASVQPLPYPFYQWFLRKYPCSASGLSTDTPLGQHPIATGMCVAAVDYEPADADELLLHEGEELAVEGFLLQGLDLFVGRSLTSGLMGFVHKKHVKPGDLKPTSPELQFMTVEEREDLYQLEPSLTHSHTHLLKQLCASDISTVYRMDKLDESDFTYIKSTPKPDPQANSMQQTVDTPPPRHSWTWPRPSLAASQRSLGRSVGSVSGAGECMSFCMDETFREAEPLEDDAPLWEELSEWEEESCEDLLSLLDTPTQLEEAEARRRRRQGPTAAAQYQPHLALAALSLDSTPSRGLGHALMRLHLHLRSSERLHASGEGQLQEQRQLCISLAWVYLHHGALPEAVLSAEKAVEAGSCLGEEEEFEARALHGWLLVLVGSAERAKAELTPLLMSLQGSDSPSPQGVVHTLLALSLRRLGNASQAGAHLVMALRLAQDSGHTPNQAVALSNLGCLALGTGAVGVAEGFLRRSLRLFQQLGGGADQEHVQSLLWMGRSYSSSGQGHKARLANETALLIAIHAKNIHSQMVVAKVLSRHYANQMLYGQSIIYYEHCVALARQLRDKRLEGEFLEILGSLYLSINTHRSSLRSLDCTKQSLRICIDLGKRREEAESWLHAGRIYYLLQEDELTDMYLQAAVRTALRVEDPIFDASIYEEAGDIFYKGHRNQLKALPYYRDGGLPFARSTGDLLCEFRLLSKVTELLMTHKHHQEALQYALLAVQSSTATGIRLHERVAYQRLACVYEALGQCELAENYFLKCVSLGPDLTHSSDARYYCKVYTHLANITLHKLKDAFDAMGYYQLALAGAMEADDVSCVYVLLMKLAELHSSHLPNAHLSQLYTHTASSLRVRLEGLTHTPHTAQEDTLTQHTAQDS